jgi:uncharacterized protein
VCGPGPPASGRWQERRALVVRVAEPAVDGRADRAAIEMVAAAVGLPASPVRITAGAAVRRKVVEVDDDGTELDDHWDQLLADPWADDHRRHHGRGAGLGRVAARAGRPGEQWSIRPQTLPPDGDGGSASGG